ncbi:hypothetical protein [Streptomyces sp. V4I8]|uniref:hypothetical protein n=1 Tax=Streptomyces sp. V4I8 TaxID=3156469 RepID=UPI0035121F8B
MSLTRVILTTGRSLDLSELGLSSTYGGTNGGMTVGTHSGMNGGMLGGYPCKPVNDLKIKDLVRAAERAHPAVPVHLVPPPREYPDQYAGAFGPVEVLPAVACVGAFHSTPLDGDHDQDPVLRRSALTIIWFQPTARVPYGCDAEEALRGVDWEALARDYELQDDWEGLARDYEL